MDRNQVQLFVSAAPVSALHALQPTQGHIKKCIFGKINWTTKRKDTQLYQHPSNFTNIFTNKLDSDIMDQQMQNSAAMYMNLSRCSHFLMPFLQRHATEMTFCIYNL